MTARPADWAPLADSDPVPGDPDGVAAEAAHMSAVAGTISEQVARLRAMSRDQAVLRGQYADRIRAVSADLAGNLEKVRGRYARTGPALRQWSADLASAQQRSLPILAQAQDAARRHAVYGQAPHGHPDPAQEQQRKAALKQAGDDLQAARDQLARLTAQRDDDAHACAQTIRNATDDGVTDSWWDRFKGFVSKYAGLIGKVCTVLEAIATVLAVIALFIPGLDLIVLAAIAVTALALIGRTMLAATGNGSWLSVAMDAFALLTFGAGRIAGSAAEGAADTAETGGDVSTEFADAGNSEESANEAEQYVYRTWGDQARQWGHSWTPDNPLEMENPRAELGLPKANSGEYLTKAAVQNMDGVTTRDALPIDEEDSGIPGGVPGGGPEWLFPDPESQLREIWTIKLAEPI